MVKKILSGKQYQNENEKTADPSGYAQPVSSPSADKRFNVEIPSISLPKGGAIKSIDEKFEVNAVNGTPNFSIPLPLGSARGFGASLGISYNSAD